MNLQKEALWVALMLWMNFSSAQAAAVAGETTTFQSPRGISESCTAITKLPMGEYSEKDLAKEKELCSIDFYNDSVALCPKTWSTSPGTIILDNSKTGLSSLRVEASNCRKDSPLDSIAKFKQTMNAADTSATFSLSSILYYHFSRALDATVDVAAAVYRTMDKEAHYNRVSSKAAPPAAAKMNAAGWRHLRKAEKNPSTYSPTGDLFTSDRQQIYGVLLKTKGERYGVEVNGTRASGWGQGQNLDFQKTPAFMALKSAQSMPQSMHEGVTQAFKNPAMAKAFAGIRPSDTQVALWMKEVSEIAILDYIFSQQDRVGNVDYRWFWIYQDPSGKVQMMKEDSKVSLLKKSTIKVPGKIAGFNPILVQKTWIGDNDAGGKTSYMNFARSTRMLENIHHLSPETYRRLYQLALDFETQGPNYQALVSSFGLSSDSLKQTLTNTKMAAAIFIKACEAKSLHFDLVSYKEAYQQQYQESVLDCRNP
ncbi:MAG: hypothetical protein ACXWRE_02360 [Pseudobdellovibrionaceae bacterium]